jgi:hypothetical protein
MVGVTMAMTWKNHKRFHQRCGESLSDDVSPRKKSEWPMQVRLTDNALLKVVKVAEGAQEAG